MLRRIGALAKICVLRLTVRSGRTDDFDPFNTDADQYNHALAEIGNPMRLRLVAISEGAHNHLELERLIQDANGGRRIGGEWFHLSPSEADGLENILTTPAHWESLQNIVAWSTDPIADYIALREKSLVVPPVNQEA